MGDWDAATYQQVSDPQEEWAAEVLAGVSLRGDERAIDAGCGSGRVTRLLAARLPHGHILAVDASQAMVDQARTHLSDLSGRVRVERADLLELSVDRPAEVILSTATFHWILDHPRLFARLFAALAPGGRLVAQCGGAGNIATVLGAIDAVAARDPYVAHLPEPVRGINFAEPGPTAERLEAAGFAGIRTWLHEKPTDVGDLDAGARYLRAIVLRHHLALLPAPLHEDFARAVARELRSGAGGQVTLDYVRLEIRAHRPGD